MSVTGREVKMGYAQSNTWGVPASVTQQILFGDTGPLEAQQTYIEDESFNQVFKGDAEVGDHAAPSGEFSGQFRYQDFDRFLAAACGSPATPTVVSSVAANSLIAYQHVINLADRLSQQLTVAADLTRYVVEVPTVRVRGFSFRVGSNGVMTVSFPFVGSRTVYTSTTNTNSTLGGAARATLGNRVKRQAGVFRINLQSGNSLVATDAVSTNTGDLSFTYARPMAEDFVFSQDYITDPIDNGFGDVMLEATFVRLNTTTANSFAVAQKAGTRFKADLTFTGPTYINSTTQYTYRMEFPNLEVREYAGPAAGGGNIMSKVKFAAMLASSSPLGMPFVRPFRATLINMNSATLLT